jgi:predicted metal-binding membrane protein
MPIVASDAIERAQAMNATWPAGSLANVASPIARPSSSTAHAASVALWVSMPIAVILVPSVPRYDGRGSDGQACVQ